MSTPVRSAYRAVWPEDAQVRLRRFIGTAVFAFSLLLGSMVFLVWQGHQVQRANTTTLQHVESVERDFAKAQTQAQKTATKVSGLLITGGAFLTSLHANLVATDEVLAKVCEQLGVPANQCVVKPVPLPSSTTTTVTHSTTPHPATVPASHASSGPATTTTTVPSSVSGPTTTTTTTTAPTHGKGHPKRTHTK